MNMLLAENSLFKTIGDIFHPIFVAVADTLAFIYGIIPQYAIAIILLTIIIMALLTPLTVKSTKSMIAMQRMQPEIKRLQQKYKGDREQLNQELMRLYKEEGINPAGGCIPLLIQMPFLIILYDTIKGLTNTITKGTVYPAGTPMAGHKCMEALCAVPRYIPVNSKMYHNLVATPGQMNGFRLDLALKPFSHHATIWGYIPYFALVIVAVILQYVQMRQMNARNPQAAQANPQMQNMQKIMPVIFAYIYFLVPAAVVLYMITSTAIRILTQDIMFRTGVVQPVGAPRSVPGREKEKPVSGATPAPALGPGKTPPKGSGAAKKPPEDKAPEDKKGDDGEGAAGSQGPKAQDRPEPRPAPRPTGRSSGNGRGRSAPTNGSTNGDTAKPTDRNRSRSKRERKAR
ncbi:MAG TPA: membrane protein insertase YidC [Acidimicrobiales bacterium]|nr:membrane protein insertase YidC [Acidimicrobiales bacterium]